MQSGKIDALDDNCQIKNLPSLNIWHNVLVLLQSGTVETLDDNCQKKNIPSLNNQQITKWYNRRNRREW